MILQQPDFVRFLLIFILQQFIALVFILLASITLRRKRDPLSIRLSLFYIFTGIGFITNAIYVLFTVLRPNNELLLTFLYFLSLDLIFSSNIFILVFIINIYKMESSLSFKRDFLLVVSFTVLVVFINLLPGGITLDNEWKPLFSWPYFLTISIIFSCVILGPTIYYSIKLYNRFIAANLKKKLRLFLIGIFGILIVFFGAALFNTWQVEIFRTIWSIIAFILTIPSAILIFYGIGTNL